MTRYLAISTGFHGILVMLLSITFGVQDHPRQRASESIAIQLMAPDPTEESSSTKTAFQGGKPPPKRVEKIQKTSKKKVINAKESQAKKAENDPSQTTSNPAQAEKLKARAEPKTGQSGSTNGVQDLTYVHELKAYVDANKFYPRLALRLKQAGTVRVRLKIAPDGQFEDIELAQKSAHVHLNQAALALIQSLKGFEPPPERLRASGAFEIPIEYKLPRRTQ